MARKIKSQIDEIKSKHSGSSDYISGVNDGIYTVLTEIIEHEDLFFENITILRKSFVSDKDVTATANFQKSLYSTIHFPIGASVFSLVPTPLQVFSTCK